MTRSFLGFAIAAALFSTPVLAADMRMPLKAPPAPVAPVTSWTGCYIDAGVGYGFYNQSHNLIDTTAVPPIALTATSNSGGEGWLGRLGGGCDYQLGSRFVIGAFADYDFANLKGTFSDGAIGGNEKMSAAWYAGGRLGYLVTPSLLAYVDGGYTEARFDQVNFSQQFLPVLPLGTFIPAHTYNGWFIGGGTEYALDFDWFPIHGLFWRTEYRYAQYQSADLAILTVGGGTGTGVHVQKDVQTITTGLVWRFNFGGPVSTRY